MATEWHIIAHESTPAQRRGIHKWIGSRQRRRDLLRRATREQASELIRLMAAIAANPEPAEINSVKA